MTAARTIVDRYPTRLTDGEPIAVPRQDPVVWGTGTGPLPDDVISEYERDGFVTIGRLLGAAEATELLSEAHRLAADARGRDDERWIREPGGDEVRSVFEVHRLSEKFATLVAGDRLAGIARQVLGSDVAIHQSRINLKPGFGGKEFDWHSDFETWHAEDGLPAMRTVSISLALTPNFACNGPLMIIPESHRTFIPCLGSTPEDHFRASLRRQEIGVPGHEAIASLAEQSGIQVLTGGAGSATVFDSNCLHGSNSNISPYPRSNVFVVYNSVDNALVAPFAAPTPRPCFIADRDPLIV